MKTATKKIPTAVMLSAITLTMVTMPGLAHAQFAGGGGGGGQGAALLNYFITNFATDLLDAAVIGAGLAMWFRGWHWGGCAMVAIGGLIFTNYTTIAAML